MTTGERLSEVALEGGPDPSFVAGRMPAGPTAGFPTTSRYRSDIDGLRAVAVIVVILTHAGVTGFSGGFVGVDIFFVISGYLIHRDLLRRIGDGHLSLFGFYGRRLRRTLPALYAMATAALIAASALLLPGDLDAFARSLLGTVALVPNIVLLTQTGYFDPVAAAKPLLHTWSLGVEEQFYLLAPFFALLLVRLQPRHRPWIFAAALGISLSLTVLVQRIAPAAAFFLMPTRAFELLCGAALAEPLLPAVRRSFSAELIGVAALAGIATAVVMFDAKTRHPGFATLLPCLSAAALIHVGRHHQTFAGRLLGTRIPRAIGLASYSLYLWHWPILVFTRYAGVPQTVPWLTSEAVLLGLITALSWRAIEQPFRNPRSPWRRRAPVLLPASAIGLVACAAALLYLHGWPSRFPPTVAAVARWYDYRDTRPFREGQCFITSSDRLADFDPATCLAMRPDRRNILLIGDSHAAHLWTGLRDVWPDVNVLQATASGCKPVLGSVGVSRCTALVNDMLSRFIPTHKLDAVVIAGLWESADIAPLVATVDALRRDVPRVVVFGPMPRYDEPLATLLAMAMLRGDPERARTHLVPTTADLDCAMASALAIVASKHDPLAKGRVDYVSPYRALCVGTDKCRLFAAPGVPLQFDYHHLTPPGADVLMAAIRARHPDLFGAPTPAH